MDAGRQTRVERAIYSQQRSQEHTVSLAIKVGVTKFPGPGTRCSIMVCKKWRTKLSRHDLHWSVLQVHSSCVHVVGLLVPNRTKINRLVAWDMLYSPRLRLKICKIGASAKQLSADAISSLIKQSRSICCIRSTPHRRMPCSPAALRSLSCSRSGSGSSTTTPRCSPFFRLARDAGHHRPVPLDSAFLSPLGLEVVNHCTGVWRMGNLCQRWVSKLGDGWVEALSCGAVHL